MPLESTFKYNKAALTHKALNNRTSDYITRLLFFFSNTDFTICDLAKTVYCK